MIQRKICEPRAMDLGRSFMDAETRAFRSWVTSSPLPDASILFKIQISHTPLTFRPVLL